MSIPQRLEQFLEHRIPYETETNDESFKSREAAGTIRKACEAIAKPVFVNVDGNIAMVVVPAAESVDLPRLRKCLGAARVRLAAESEFRHLFSDCDDGAMPIFGSVYGTPVLIAHELTDNEEISFLAGTPHDIVRVCASGISSQSRDPACAPGRRFSPGCRRPASGAHRMVRTPVLVQRPVYDTA